MTEPARHPIAADVEAELEGLGLWSLRVHAPGGGPVAGTRDRLRVLSDRIAGAEAVAMRQRPIPHAYRVFYRHAGLDPDVRRTPIDEAVVRRMLKGGFVSEGRIADALLVALVETGVPVWALAAPAVRGTLELRLATAADAFVPEGLLAIADADGPLAELFGPIAPRALPADGEEQLLLVALVVKGVPALYVQEALHLAAEALGVADL